MYRTAHLGAKRRYDKVDTIPNTYLLTITKHQKKDYVSKENLNTVITELKLRLPTLHFTHYAYENSGYYKQLHFHGVCTARTGVSYRKNASIFGYQLMWKPVFNLAGAISYVTKEACSKASQADILVENYYNHNYGFLD